LVRQDVHQYNYTDASIHLYNLSQIGVPDGV
jgi:hypothetical protein